MRDGAIACDAAPADFLAWAGEEAPELQTPGARLFSLAGLRPLPTSVKAARRVLGVNFTADAAVNLTATAPEGPAALSCKGVWFERKGGAAVLRGVDLEVRAGERVALMGRNGAGKTTLLKVAAGLLAPTRGKLRRAGRVALVLQHPGDYALHERVGDELTPEALAAAGLGDLAERHPRDLSGGERQRLAIAIVLDGDRPAVLCLDEPTRGMDRARKDALAAHLRELSGAGTAVVVATHDAEFAAALAPRTVLLGDGRPVADAPTAEVLAGGWYFATQTARILAGAALLPEDGAALLRVRGQSPHSHLAAGEMAAEGQSPSGHARVGGPS